MFKKIKQLFCKHERTVYANTDLVLQSDGSWITEHAWRCKNCGKVISGK